MISALATDFYELTMAAGYWRAGLLEPATFELFVRRLPPRRSYLVAAGLDDALAYLEGLRFSESDRAWLAEQPQFGHVPPEFFDDYLRTLTFTGGVWAVPEGTPVFAGEPILRVTAPLPAAQIVETALLAIVGFQTSVASKAARIVDAAQGRPVIEFGARRAHGLGASLAAARAAFIGGCAATSFVEAARRYGIPASGTMAHSWVQSFATEAAAFREFSRSFEAYAVYLLDTYDTIGATRTLIDSGMRPPMVRLDSGDLDALGREVRVMLDRAGLHDTKIFATGDLDEDRIAELLAAGAPLDGFGVGTMLSTVADAPALSAVYKLVQLERHHRRVGVVKLSPGKETWPEPKQVWRVIEGDRAVRDVVAVENEPPIAGATALLTPAMRDGRRVAPCPPLGALQQHCRKLLAMLPPAVRALDAEATLPVVVSDRLAGSRPAAKGSST